MDKPTIRAILFDLWGTLVIDEPALGQARVRVRIELMREALAARGFLYDADAIAGALTAAVREHEAIHATERDISARGRTLLALRNVDPELPGRLDDDAWRALDEAMLTPAIAVPPVMAPGAAEVLAQVKALGLATALVSNAGTTPGFVLSRILDDFGLLGLLDVTIYSDEVEIAKPAPAIFEAALDGLGLSHSEAAFVGDHPVLDVYGARRAGVWSIQIGTHEQNGHEPHARIERLTDLVPALRDLGVIRGG